MTQTGSTGWAESAALSPDGTLLLTGRADGVVMLWEVETGALLRILVGHGNSPIESLAFSPDGARAVTAGGLDRTVRVWDLASGLEQSQIVPSLSGEAVSSYDVAMSPDGRTIATGGWEQRVRLWDVETGAELRRFELNQTASGAIAFTPDAESLLVGDWEGVVWQWRLSDGALEHRLEGDSEIRSVAVSADGQLALVGSTDSTAVVWDLESGGKLHVLEGHIGWVESVAFSSDRRFALTGSHDGSVRMWDVDSGSEVHRFGLPNFNDRIEWVGFSPDETRVLVAGALGDRERISWGENEWDPETSGYYETRYYATIWDVPAGGEERRFEGLAGGVLSGAISDGGDRVLTGGHGSTAASLWDLETGMEASRLGRRVDPSSGLSSWVSSTVFHPDGRRAVTGVGHEARIWNLETGSESKRLGGHTIAGSASVSLSADGRRALTDVWGNVAIVHDVDNGNEIARFELEAVRSGRAVLSPDGSRALAPGYYKVILWDVDSGEVLRVWESSWEDVSTFQDVSTVGFSPDGQRAFFADAVSGRIHLLDLQTGAEIRVLEGDSSGVTSAVFSADGRRLLSGSRDGTARLWDLETGSEFRHFAGHAGSVESVALSAVGHLALTAGLDGTSRLWDIDSGNQLASLISFDDGGWAVVGPGGRFQVSDLERVDGLHWVFSDEPFKSVPLEVFMRDYYEPRLLPRILAGEAFADVGDLPTRNRVQPVVRITGVEVVDTTATVILEVAGASRHFGAGEDSVLVESGAADLRLFRAGQMVRWRDGSLDRDPVAGVARVRFEDVRLPLTGADSVTFSAYAFNENYTSSDGREWIGRVKSKTAYATVALPDAGPRRGRAYVVTVGVDAYEDPAWDLSFAANDAWALSEELSGRLAASVAEEGPYEEVVTVPLVAAHEPERTTEATKAVIRGLLDLLAGRVVPAEVRSRIPNADRIRRATPEDLVLVSFSSHGYADSAGTFYLLPSDIGEETGKRVTPALLKRAVSSDELSEWLRPVDAGEMVLIVDACHSAAAVEGVGFKPGPMGSRGFGQLAYNKGMRVLAASQAEDVALESELLEQGLLTHALVRDGLESGQADHQPVDGVIDLGEWLRYGVERVPSLFEEVQAGEVQTFGRSEPVGGRADEDPLFQVPALFDFRRSEGRQGVRLSSASR